MNQRRDYGARVIVKDGVIFPVFYLIVVNCSFNLWYSAPLSPL